jgi:hypothetical protein
VRRILLPLVALLTSAGPAVAAGEHPPGCPGAAARIEAIPGAPGAFRIGTRAGSRVVRVPPPARAGDGPLYVIDALDLTWDADRWSVTVVDTLVVPVGATVRWRLVTGIHTLTNGRDYDDPEWGTAFDYLLYEDFPVFDTTFTVPDTLDYFCGFHLPTMVGTVVIRADVGVPAPVATRFGFVRPPAPNPSRGGVTFVIGLREAGEVDVQVVDPAGRRVATVHRGPLAAGEHLLRWNGRDASGAPARPGVYRAALRAGGRRDARAFTLLR